MAARLVEVKAMLCSWRRFNTFVFPGIQLYFCAKHTHNSQVLTGSLIDVMRGSLTPTLNMSAPISGGHSRLARHFLLTTAKETRTDTNSNRLLITLLG